MTQTIQYEENYGVQSPWIDTHEAKPFTINTTFFIDIDNNTVAKASTLIDAKELLKNYPDGEIRCWSPTQEEYEAELLESKRLNLNNFGIII